MKRKVVSLLGVAALVLGAAIFVAPPASDAVVINSVLVDVGGVTWCQVGGACNFPIWTLPGTNLAPGADLILAQTNGFNFDSSQRNGVGVNPDCGPSHLCLTSITINGTPILTAAPNTVLAFGNQDFGSIITNEAANYVSAGGVPFAFDAFIGYADNVHTGTCGDTTGTGTLGNCQPDPFGALSPNAVGALNPGLTETNPNHCGNAPATNCFDSGVLRIVGLAPQQKIPEPSTLLLLGTGLLGVAAWSRRRLQGKN